jgi:hypothetical protein
MKISEIFVTVDIVLIRKLIDDYELLLIKEETSHSKIIGLCLVVLLIKKI